MFASEHITYLETNAFSKFVIDYIQGKPQLQQFHSFPTTLEGIKLAIERRQQQKVERDILVEVLKDQYSTVEVCDEVSKNIEALQQENCFTVCTAHQPALFTGPLYFIYKILHTIKLAAHIQQQYSDIRIVPVYYMGSEDADFDELGHFTVEGKKYVWKTTQTGAFGRFKVDKSLVQLITDLEGQLVGSFSAEWIAAIRRYFKIGDTIQNATFKLIDFLFKKFGLIVLIADDRRLKRLMIPVFTEDLFEQKPSAIVQDTCSKLDNLNYNVQANPREINLFYMTDGVRARIVQEGDCYKVHKTNFSFSELELEKELNDHPEHFSPNVILRGLYQETILPNLAFLGGGGELAYWTQLKDLFETYNVCYPILLLRNSFLIVTEKQDAIIQKLGLTTVELFKTELQIVNSLIEKQGRKPHLNGQLDKLTILYDELKSTASQVDPTLEQHVQALKVKAVNRLMILEKKMLRSERKKYEAKQRQVNKLKTELFPSNGLQERIENVSSFYSKWGMYFIEELYRHSLTLEQQFTVLYQKN